MCAFVFAGGVFVTDAFAVAGKVDMSAPAASSLAGTEITFDLKDGDPVTTAVGPDGTFDAPAKVNKNNVSACYRKEVTATGETKRVDVDCGLFVFGGGAAATAMASSAAGAPEGRSHILRISGFGGVNLANDVNDIRGTAPPTSGFGYSKFDTTNSFTAGAGIDWKMASGWVIGVHYQFLQEGIKGQTVQETALAGGPSTARTLVGGTTQSNVAAFNFGYEWDCWKVAGKQVSLQLGGGPVVGSTSYKSANGQFDSTKAATGYNAQATVFYHLGRGFNAFAGYQYVHISTDWERIGLNPPTGKSIAGDLNSHVVRAGISYDINMNQMFGF
jgi:opacity protein-like surface antigen